MKATVPVSMVWIYTPKIPLFSYYVLAAVAGLLLACYFVPLMMYDTTTGVCTSQVIMHLLHTQAYVFLTIF